MARSINKVTLLGNLTRDPELKYTPNGTAVCTFGLATNRSWTTQDGKTRDDVQFHRIVAWQKLAELCGKLLTKGRKAYLEGRITYRDYVDKTGQQRYMTEIVLDDFIVFPTTSSRPQEDDISVETKKSEKNTEEKEEKKENNNEDVNPDDIPF